MYMYICICVYVYMYMYIDMYIRDMYRSNYIKLSSKNYPTFILYIPVQTLHRFADSGNIREPSLHLKSFPKSGMF